LGGKSEVMTQIPLMWRDDPHFTGLFTRVMLKQLLGSGGLWEIAAKYYPLLGAKSVKMPLPMYTFPSGARLRYSQISGMTDAEALRGKLLPRNPSNSVKPDHSVEGNTEQGESRV